MRRIYYMNPKRQQIVQDAMVQLRATREALGPEFLTRIRMLIKDFDPEYLKQFGVAADSVPEDGGAVSRQKAHTVPVLPTEPVDQKKNLLIIMKFLQLKQDNKSVQTQVRTLLSETNTIQ